MSIIYYTNEGKQICLDKELGRGGEGPVYSIQGIPSICAKIYSKQLSSDDYEKLSVMVRNPPQDPSYSYNKHRSIAWPGALLFTDPKMTRFAGLVMPKIDLTVFRTAFAFISPDDRRKRYLGGVTWKYLFVMARNISSAIAAIHERGYCMGDINESNILIAPDALITLIDCDSFQVRDVHSNRVYRCPVGKEEYTAPELQGKSFKDVNRTFETDNFALGVLMFQFLMEGFHPYSGRWLFSGDPLRMQDKIIKGLYPYGRKLNELATHPDAPPFEIIHPDIQRLFHRCFVDGHGNPKERPTAKEWQKVADGLMDKFITCQQNENHHYLNHLQDCPWCRYKKDSFPSHAGLQIELINPNKTLSSHEDRVDYLRSYIDMALADGVLTPDEEKYIIDLGLKLQIQEKEIRKILDNELKKSKSPNASAAAPVIEIQETKFEFLNMKKDSKKSDVFTLANIGSGVLTGTIKTNRKWLTVSQDKIDPSKHKQTIEFTIDTTGLGLGQEDNGEIVVQSNGRTERIYVKISMEVDKDNLSRFARRLTTAGLILGALIGAGIYYLNIPDYKYSWVIFVGSVIFLCSWAVYYENGISAIPSAIWAGLVISGIALLLCKILPTAFYFTMVWASLYGAYTAIFSKTIRKSLWRGQKMLPITIGIGLILLSVLIVQESDKRAVTTKGKIQKKSLKDGTAKANAKTKKEK